MTSSSDHDAVTGTVTAWHDIEGWGVISSPDVPGEVWAHFSLIVASGYRALTVGETVTFTWEEFPQDGYRFRAVQIFHEAS
ncbi:cold-shock protein [Streptosporangium sp. NPDC004631]